MPADSDRCPKKKAESRRTPPAPVPRGHTQLMLSTPNGLPVSPDLPTGDLPFRPNKKSRGSEGPRQRRLFWVHHPVMTQKRCSLTSRRGWPVASMATPVTMRPGGGLTTGGPPAFPRMTPWYRGAAGRASRLSTQLAILVGWVPASPARADAATPARPFRPKVITPLVFPSGLPRSRPLPFARGQRGPHGARKELVV